VTALSALGFDVQLASSNFAQVQAMLAARIPPIIFVETGPLSYWNVDNAHVVVFVGQDGTHVYLNDPYFDVSPQQVTLAEFQLAWTLTSHLAAFLQPKS
jgi:ABC-type bacteriocin/lantibiotic exporter with double-glycine peptidase domain